MVDDEELLELVEMEVRELLSSVRLPGRRHSDRQGSALAALEGATRNRRELDPRADGRGRRVHPDARSAPDKPFLMPIEDVFSISAAARS